jgi:putative transposase
MYSYEEKFLAVELYIKLGKRVKATIRQLGYPTKNALKSWYREHERRGDLAKRFHHAPKYSPPRSAAVHGERSTARPSSHTRRRGIAYGSGC